VNSRFRVDSQLNLLIRVHPSKSAVSFPNQCLQCKSVVDAQLDLKILQAWHRGSPVPGRQQAA
jgi:hypothetical protein